MRTTGCCRYVLRRGGKGEADEREGTGPPGAEREGDGTDRAVRERATGDGEGDEALSGERRKEGVLTMWAERFVRYI